MLPNIVDMARFTEIWREICHCYYCNRNTVYGGRAELIFQLRVCVDRSQNKGHRGRWTGVECGIQRRSNPRTVTRCPRGLESGIRALTGTSGISGVDVQNIMEEQKEGQKGKKKRQ